MKLTMNKAASVLLILFLFLLADYLFWLPPPLDPQLALWSPARTTLVAVGDILLARNLGALMTKEDDWKIPFKPLAKILSDADIAFGNLEGPFCPRPPFTRSGIVFRADPRGVAGLEYAGFDVLSLANNHSWDGGSACARYSRDLVSGKGILTAGVGKDFAEAHAPRIVERNGVRFAFLAYTYAARNIGHYLPRDLWVDEVAHLDAGQVRVDVAAALGQADVVIVSVHEGTEYTLRLRPLQQAFARAAIDAGASLVLGHHPHVPQRIERYQQGWIFYSLGNFVFWQFQKGTRQALMARLVFTGARLERVEAVPVFIDEPGIPRFATEEEAAAILSRIGLRHRLLWPATQRR